MNETSDTHLEAALFWGDTLLQHVVRPAGATLTVGEESADFLLPVEITGGDFILVEGGAFVGAPGESGCPSVVEVGQFRFEVRRVEAMGASPLRAPILRPMAVALAGCLLFVGAVLFVPPSVNAEPEPTPLRAFVLVSVEGAPADLDVPSPTAQTPRAAAGFEPDPVSETETEAAAQSEPEPAQPTLGIGERPRGPRRARTHAAGSDRGARSSEPSHAPSACVNGVCAPADLTVGGDPPTSEPEPEGLSRSQLEAVVLAHGSDVRACLATARLIDANAAGRVRLRLVVGTEGRVLGVDLLEDSAGAGTCLAATVRGWRFPTADGRTRTELPFDFE